MPSALLTSVQGRLKGATNFESYYNNLCALQDTVPVQSVKAHLGEGALDINADRIRLPDWGPILNSIRINKSLSFIGIRSYFQQIKDNDDALGRQGVRRRPPAVRSKEVVNRLCLALKECLLNSSSLQYLELQSLPLKEKDVTNLAKGLSRASFLEHLSLEGCRLNNKAISVLCHNIRNSTSLVSLNLTGCGLTCNAAHSIAKVVKHQSTRRHSEAWKESLRYRRPDLDRMAGIRRITLNSNPLLNDEGAAALADAIQDDLWLKALDLQHCGLSNAGAQVLLNALHENSTIVVLDLRKNALIDHEMVKAVIEQVMINGGGHESEYKWLRSSESSERPTRRKVKQSTKVKDKNASKQQVATVRVSRSRIRSKSADGRLTVKSEVPTVRRPGPGFVPWRTAARAVSRGASTERCKNESDISTPTKDSHGVHFHLTTTSTPTCSDTSVKDTSSYGPDRHNSSASKWMEKQRQEKRKEDKEIRVQLEEMRRRHQVESQARSAADAHVVELQVENSRLRHEIHMLKARGPSSPFKKQVEQRSNGLADLDEGVLDSIEESFRKFHTFLDLLRDAGLGQLCTLVGLSPGDIKNPAVVSILRDHQPTPVSKTVPHQHEQSRLEDSVYPQQHPGGYSSSLQNGLTSKITTHQYTEKLTMGMGEPADRTSLMVGTQGQATGSVSVWAQPPPTGFAPAPTAVGFQQPSAGLALPPPTGFVQLPTAVGFQQPSAGLALPLPASLAPAEGFQPPPIGVQPANHRPPPAGLIHPQNIYYTQSSESYQPQLPLQNHERMYAPQSQVVQQSTAPHIAEMARNVGKIHITGPAQTQDILDHVDAHSPEGQDTTESQRFQNIVKSGVATMPKTSSMNGSMPSQQPDLEIIAQKPNPEKLIIENQKMDNEIANENNNVSKPGLLELNGDKLVIQGEISKPVIDKNTKDIIASVDIRGPRGDAIQNFTTKSSPVPSPERSPVPSPEMSPLAYSDSWASGSSNQSNAYSNNSKHSNGNSEKSINSRDLKTDDQQVTSEKSKHDLDLESERSSPVDIVEELLDYSSDDEF